MESSLSTQAAPVVHHQRQLTNTEKKLMPHAISQKVKVYDYTAEPKIPKVENVEESSPDQSQEVSCSPINLMTKYGSVAHKNALFECKTVTEESIQYASSFESNHPKVTIMSRLPINSIPQHVRQTF